MSTQHFPAQDYEYFFKNEARDLTVYDSLCFVDMFGHFTDGQAGIVMRTLADEVRRLNKVIFDAEQK